jgi:hypothetical protein
MSVKFYTFSFHNEVREAGMRHRFELENLSLEFVEPVENSDPRLVAATDEIRRNWAIMFNHLDMLTKFLESDAKYGIFCEDDIFIRRGIKNFLPEILANFERRGLEILLLGYLLPFKPVEILPASNSFEPHEINFTFHKFPEDMWGSQMYLLSRVTAKRLLDKYTLDYAKKALTDSSMTPFSPDWTLTKDGRRAALYPMLAVEEGIVVTTHQGQVDFHKRCFQAQYDEKQFH